MQRRRFENLKTFSLKDEANDLRKQAQGMLPSIRRDDIMRLAQQAEAMQDLLQQGHQADTAGHAPIGTRREAIFDMLERLRKFRNNVMHRYAIFDKNPVAEYNNIRTLLHWRCPHTRWLMSELSNPAAVTRQHRGVSCSS